MSDEWIVFGVCHPDDESLWAGGFLSAVVRSGVYRAAVVCLSGNDPASPRMAEFANAMRIAGVERSVILGSALRAALTPLPPLGAQLDEGLSRLGIPVDRIRLLVTHSPFGDEHCHPHHVQAFKQLGKWARARGVPFSFFSCLPIPYLSHRPNLAGLRRSSELVLLSWARCRAGVRGWIHWAIWRRWGFRSIPRHYVQFLVDGATKSRMLACYPSIDLEQHRKGYAMFDNPVEAIYLHDRRALKAVQRLWDRMEVPGAPRCFPSPRGLL
jgi:LmbE family N-acetylglucosaminyl deacetylase